LDFVKETISKTLLAFCFCFVLFFICFTYWASCDGIIEETWKATHTSTAHVTTTTVQRGKRFVQVFAVFEAMFFSFW